MKRMDIHVYIYNNHCCPPENNTACKSTTVKYKKK